MAKSSPNNDGHNRFLHSISFCGTHRLMENISNYIFEHLELKQKPTVYDYKDRQLSDIHIQNIEDIKKLEIGCIKTPLYILGVKKKNIIIS